MGVLHLVFMEKPGKNRCDDIPHQPRLMPLRMTLTQITPRTSTITIAMMPKTDTTFVNEPIFFTAVLSFTLFLPTLSFKAYTNAHVASIIETDPAHRSTYTSDLIFRANLSHRLSPLDHVYEISTLFYSIHSFYIKSMVAYQSTTFAT